MSVPAAPAVAVGSPGFPKQVLGSPAGPCNVGILTKGKSLRGDSRRNGDRDGRVYSSSGASIPRRSSQLRSALATAPVLQPSSDSDDAGEWRLDGELAELRQLVQELRACENDDERSAVLNASKRVRGVFGAVDRPGNYVNLTVVLARGALSERELYSLKCLVAIGQERLLECPVQGDYAARDESQAEPVSGGTQGSYVKQVLVWLGNAIRNCSWEGPERIHPLNAPALWATRDEELRHSEGGSHGSASAEDVGRGENDARLLQSLKVLVTMLARLEKVYDCIGGIIGYQLKALELIKESELGKQNVNVFATGNNSYPLSPRMQFYAPEGPDLSQDKAFSAEATIWGLEGLPELGEIYPLGGAGDRLGLVDESTGECLPVAMLPYCGRTLLEGLIRDLQAREFLYFKVYGAQHITPVAIMTSAAKRNNERVHDLCESRGWFGRSKENFQLFDQPLVPTVAAEDGRWLVTEPLKAVLKPGGHGMLWKLAKDEGLFEWFYQKGRKAALVRQISNTVAGTDCTLLALSGIGLKHKKKLGFASCERTVGTAEGVNVLMERQEEDGTYEYAVTCIEYTEFRKLGIADVPKTSGSMQAQFPANTNVLYVDLPSVERVASSPTPASLPGMIMNLKKHVEYEDQWGNMHRVRAGRLECTMQNVADSLMNKHISKLSSKDQGKLDTYLTFNQRRRVTSSAKRRRKQGEDSLHQTPDGSFLDITRNARDLLTSCGVYIPQMEGNHCYVDTGPPFLVYLHPSLGPLWDIVRQKIKGGSIGGGSELQLEVAELSWTDVQLSGSLSINATNIMGSLEVGGGKQSVLQYGLRCGRCRMVDVHVKNKGVDWSCSQNTYWKNKIRRLESLEIFLEEDAEFDARSVTIEGPHQFFVPKGHRMIVTTNPSGGINCILEALPTNLTRNGSWNWNYKLEESGKIVLTMVDG